MTSYNIHEYFIMAFAWSLDVMNRGFLIFPVTWHGNYITLLFKVLCKHLVKEY